MMRQSKTVLPGSASGKSEPEERILCLLNDFKNLHFYQPSLKISLLTLSITTSCVHELFSQRAVTARRPILVLADD